MSSKGRRLNLDKWQNQDIFTVDEYLSLYMRYRPYIIDVRTWEEYCKGHLCGAHHIEVPHPPLAKKDVDRFREELKRLCLEKDRLIIVYCKLGKRAGFAQSILKSFGYKNVLSLGGVDKSPLKEIVKGKDSRIKICLCKN